MVQINFAQKQVNAKIVYYGPGMSGKTTNLEIVHQRAPAPNKGDLTSISTDGDRTLFFDFMPLDLGTVAGMRTCFQIYTVPGQVYYNSTRKLVLQGVDGVVFVADSSAAMVEENLESLRNLEQNLNEYGKSISSMAVIIQYNKRDLPDALPVDELNRLLNPHGCPFYEAIANTGQGVFPTLKAMAARVLETLHSGNKAQAPTPTPPSPLSAAQTGFHRAPAGLPTSAPQAPAPVPTAAGLPRPLGQTGFHQTGFHAQPSLRPAANIAAQSHAVPAQASLPQAPSFAGTEPLARTSIHAPPSLSPAQGSRMGAPMAQPLAAAQHTAPTPSMTLEAPAPAATNLHQTNLHMMRPDLRSDASGAHAPAAAPRRAAMPAARPATQAPAQRIAPRSTPLPTPQPGSKKKAMMYTAIFVVGALGIGAVVAKVFLSIF